ncbi:hypothetical protein LFM09_45110 [Lentzea alba]|uniref:hypothetical protein n=1 Tax=Lentzea alba TaxID=2714351 RepID=UPI0039BEF7A5
MTDQNIRLGSVRGGTAKLDQWRGLGEEGSGQWRRYGWELARHFLAALQEHDSRQTTAVDHGAVQWCNGGHLQHPEDISTVHQRRSQVFAAPQPITATQHRYLVSTLLKANARHDWLLVGEIVQLVEGIAPGSYLWQRDPQHFDMRRNDDLAREVRQAAQGQGFVTGGGCVFFLGVDWNRLAALGGTPEQHYRDALVTIGGVGQALVLSALMAGLGSRMTPAVHESTAAALFALPGHCEMLYLIKIGPVPK